MAPAGGSGLTGVYRQRKKKSGGGGGNVGVAKPAAATKRSNKTKPQQQQRNQDDRRHGGQEDDDRDDGEEELRRFDMDMAYGPCIGVTRLRRWERAAAMGLNPPPRVRDLLLCSNSVSSSSPPKSSGLVGSSGTSLSVQLECIWEGKV